MEDENITDMTKIEIPVTETDVKGKQICTAEDRDVKSNIQDEPWIVQIQQRYYCGHYKKLETSPRVCIYRVSESVKNKKSEAYDPLVVSLGPYHHKKLHSTPMDDHKLQAVEKTLGRLHNMTMSDIISEVSNLQYAIRDCYEDSASEWDRETLVWMLTMDACFILEFLRDGLPNSSLVFNNIKSRDILLDIFKLENQIPLCILKKILQLELEDSEEVPMGLAKLLNNYSYFKGFPFRQASGVKKIGEKEIRNIIIERRPRHLLDLCRVVIADSFILRCGFPNGITRQRRWTDILSCLFRSAPTNQDTPPSAEKLQKAGIQCKPSPDGKVQFIPGSFGRSTLLLPQITIEDSTEMFLRNLMAFEECTPRGHQSRIMNIISLYVCFMDDLIDSKEDVGLLVKQDIIGNLMGSEQEVATIFNDLCSGITYGDSEFMEVTKMVNEHYNRQLNVLMSQFKEEHCSRPWYIISFVAAVLILGMTAVQTVFSVKK